jgi:hypothetical protein
MAVKRLEDAARRLVKKIADLALGPVIESTPRAASAPAGERSQASAPDATATPLASPAPTPATGARPAIAAALERPATPSTETPTETSPIRTRTLARLLAAQGYTARALAVYDALLVENPADTALADEAASLRVGGAPSKTSAMATIPAADAALEGDRITASVVDAGTLFVHWESTPAGAARARTVAETAGRSAGEPAPTSEQGLALRVVVLRADEAGVVRSEAIEHADAPAGGERFITGLPAEATLFAALGVRRGERFVAITHAPAAYTPPATPAALPALEFAAPPAPPASAVDATPPAPPQARPLSAERSAEVLRRAEALTRPDAWSHASDAHAASPPDPS